MPGGDLSHLFVLYRHPALTTEQPPGEYMNPLLVQDWWSSSAEIK